MSDVRFIRKNGRIIPIRNSMGAPRNINPQQSPTNYSKFAGAGVASSIIKRIGAKPAYLELGNAHVPVLLKNKKSLVAAGAIGTAVVAANAYDSIKHGNEVGSFWSGVGRFIKNQTSFLGGKLGYHYVRAKIV